MMTPRENAWVIDAVGLAVVTIITVTLYIAFVRPALDMSAREEITRERISTMRSSLVAVRLKARQLEQRVVEVRELAGEQVQLSPGDALLMRRADLTRLFGEHDLVLDEFQSGTPDPADGFVRHPLTLRGAGSFPDLVAMVTALHERFPDILIESVALHGNPLKLDEARSVVLQVTWYAAASAPR